MRRWMIMLAAFSAVWIGRSLPVHSQAAADEPPWQAFIEAASVEGKRAQAALAAISARWRDNYAAMILDVVRMLPPPRSNQAADAGPVPTRSSKEAESRRRLTAFLERQTRQRFGHDLGAWRKWVWALPDNPHADYPSFKAELYSHIDPRFRTFFPPRVPAKIRLDEVEWGGVTVNGIPPLRFPKHIPAADATWLRDGHIVFGITVNGEARAYPKRILGWHEMALDRVGGLDLTIVYCTLCGTVIPYESGAAGRRWTFGTSGLLYRSNKLMFDEETNSLWSSLEGVPVVGRLVDRGIRLPLRSVVTTTWGDWKRTHPATSVLSLETGFERNYREGEAYREYFGTDRLMFEVPRADTRLRNKDEVLVLRPDIIGNNAAPVAIAVERLQRERVFQFDAGGRGFVVVTSRAGANMVFDRSGQRFTPGGPDGSLRDAAGRQWTVVADGLVNHSGERLVRIPAHRAFWFGWVAQYPRTELYK
jgi:hypothetical protein